MAKKLQVGMTALLCSLLAMPANAQQMMAVPMAPRIHTIYATPMKRINEIPNFGRNRGMFFHNAPQPEQTPFGNAGLYVFASFAQGATREGVNAENPRFMYGSEANTTMGDATSISFGVGRRLNSTVNLEVAYTSLTGMSYGLYARWWGQEEAECWWCEYDEDWDDFFSDPSSMVTVPWDGDLVLSGGAIRSDFFSVGMQYRLDRTFGTLLGGMVRPFVAGHIGLALNTIDDYTLLSSGWVDDGGIFEFDYDDGSYTGFIWEGECTDPRRWCNILEYSEATVLFKGATTRNFAFALEAGITLAIERNFQIEFFYRMSNLGRVATSGTAIVDQIIDRMEILNMESDVFFMADCIESVGSAPGCDALGDMNFWLNASQNPDAFVETFTANQCFNVFGGSDFNFLPGVWDESGFMEWEPQAHCMDFMGSFRDVEALPRHTESGTLSTRQFGVRLQFLF